MRRAVVLLVAFTACGRDTSHADAQSTRREPTESCLADDIRDLHTQWTERTDCSDPGSDDPASPCGRACGNGDPDACFSLAVVLERAESSDDATAATRTTELFQRACIFGLAGACTNWAARQLFGDAKRPSNGCLYRVFDKACAAGERFGCGMVGRMLVERARTPIDPVIAYSQLSNACDKLEGPPCRFLALYIERGVFGAPGRARVKALLERACASGDEDACGKQTAEETMLSD